MGSIQKSSRPLLIAIGLALAPFSILVFKIVRHGFFFPFWDEWYLAKWLDMSYAGNLSFAQLWAQHNEHRLIFPKLLLISLARITKWSVACELGTSIFLGLFMWLFLTRLVFRTAGSLEQNKPYWVLPALSMFVFSWVQMENWVWGWQVQIFLCMATAVAGICALSGQRVSWLRFATATILGIAASFSFACGLLYWVAALPLLFFSREENRKVRIARLLIWFATTALVFQLYFMDYTKPVWTVSVAQPDKQLLDFVRYIILALGSPVTGTFSALSQMDQPTQLTFSHYAAGSAGICLFLFLCAHLLIKKRACMPVLAPFFALAAFSVGSALLTGFGRLAVDLSQALSSRYSTFSIPFWCALVGLAAISAGTNPAWLPASKSARKIGCLAAVVLFIALQVSLFDVNRRNAAVNWETVATWRRMSWTSLRVGNESPVFANQLCWSGEELVNDFLPLLKKHELAGFGEMPEADPGLAEAYLARAREFFAEENWAPAAAYAKSAVLYDPDNAEAAELLKEIEMAVQSTE